MNWITCQIAIGNYREAQDVDLLRQHSFRAILSLDGSLTEEQEKQLGIETIVSVQLVDGEGNDIRRLRLAVESLCQLVQFYTPVLVQCHAGRSRSAIVVAGYLVQELRIDAEQALTLIASKREINVTPCLKELLYKL